MSIGQKLRHLQQLCQIQRQRQRQRQRHSAMQANWPKAKTSASHKALKDNDKVKDKSAKNQDMSVTPFTNTMPD